MADGVTIARLAGGLLRSGVGVFALGLTTGFGLILHYFYVTPFDRCVRRHLRPWPSPRSGPGRYRCSPQKDLRLRLPRWGLV